MAKVYLDNGSVISVEDLDINNIESRLMRGRQLNYYKTKDKKYIIFISHISSMELDVEVTEEQEEDVEERVLAEIVAEQSEKPHKCKFEYRFRKAKTGATQYFKYCPLCGKQSRIIAKKDVPNPDDVQELKE